MSAFNKSALGTYVEENKDYLLSEAVLASKAMKMFPLQTGVQYKSKIPILDTEAHLTQTECGFPADGGSVTFTQREIETVPITIGLKFCLDELQKTYIQYNRTAGAETMPYEQYILQDINKSINNKIGLALWQGTTASATPDLANFNGWLKIAVDDCDKISLGTASITAYEAIEKVYLGIPDEVIDNAVIYVGMDKYRVFSNDALKLKLPLTPISVNYEDGSYFPGSNTKVIPLMELNGTNYIVAGPPRNFLIGTDFSGAYETYDFFFSREEQKFLFICKFNLGAQIIFPDEVVFAVHS